MTRFTQLLATAAAVVAVAGCSMTATTDKVGASDSSTRASSSSGAPSDSAGLARLEREAVALAHNDGCTTSDQCRVAPVGAKACGGPRYWITYCSASTDSAALFQKLEALRTAEQSYNQVHGVISDCSIVPAPNAVVSAGVCRAGP